MERQRNLDSEIRDIWTDAFRFHATFEPMGNSEEEWTLCAKTAAELSHRHGGHPLANGLLLAVYGYLEDRRRGLPEQAKMEGVVSYG